jgi:hypothetical protein
VMTRVQDHFDAGADHVCIQALDAQSRGVPVETWRELGPAVDQLSLTRTAA